MTNNTEILKEYNLYLCENKPSKKTVIAYYSNVQRFLNFANVHFSEINNTHINKYLNHLQFEKQLSAQSLHQAKHSIVDFIKYIGIQVEEISSLPKIQRAISYIPSDSDFKKFLSSASQKPGYEGIRNKTILSIMYHAGLRPEEAHLMNVESVNFDERNLYIKGKRNKNRVVPINDTLFEDLQNHEIARSALKAKSNALFLSAGKNHKLERVSYGHLRCVIREVFKKAEMPHLEPYSLRHAFCTRLVRSGAALDVAAKMMGHSNVSSIFDYYVPDNLDGRDAVKALNF